ncbi:uncharacterized protein LOC126315238 [Schistocerca gregaria]|uniref:uncharacterized protein LOC126315238 n=1 Tax=Schistocerca gregaria TaxID=7010 RepID=UPI00211E7268|nr:uncharacterized protein LOC126315238 [Schistocerca gregaria]
MNRVVVSNISPNTSEDVISDFFVFCGPITDVEFVNASPDEKVAYITFEHPHAAQTSLILSNAMIEDRQLQVRLDTGPQKLVYVNLEHVEPSESPTGSSSFPESAGTLASPPNTSEPPLTTEGTESAQDQKPTEYVNPVPRNNATSAVAAMLAAGYQLNDNALAQARALDNRFGLSESISTGWLSTKGKLVELDQQFGISEKIKELTQQAGERLNQLGLTAKATAFSAATDQYWNNLISVARENWDSTLRKSNDWIQENAPDVVEGIRKTTASIKGTVQNIKEESEELYTKNKESAK